MPLFSRHRPIAVPAAGAALTVLTVLTVLLLALAFCAPRSDTVPPSGPGDPGGPAGALGVLYVGDVAARSITALDPQTGAPAGPPIPFRGAPAQIVPVSGGDLLVAPLTSFAASDSHVTHIAAAGAVSTIPLDPAAREVLLAPQAADLALAVYAAPSSSTSSSAYRCHLALLQLRLKAVLAVHHVCRGQEVVTSVVLGDGPQPRAYVTLLGSRDGHETHRLDALDALDGAVLASLPFTSPTRCFAVAPAPLPSAAHLFCVTPLAEDADGDADASGWLETSRVLVVRADTLTVERTLDAGQRLRNVAVAPRATHLYGIGRSRDLVALDLQRGSATVLATLPRQGSALAVSDTHVFVAAPLDGEVWSIPLAPQQPGSVSATPRPLSLREGTFPLALASSPPDSTATKARFPATRPDAAAVPRSPATPRGSPGTPGCAAPSSAGSPRTADTPPPRAPTTRRAPPPSAPAPAP